MDTADAHESPARIADPGAQALPAAAVHAGGALSPETVLGILSLRPGPGSRPATMRAQARRKEIPRKGNVFLKSALFAAASAAVRTKDSYYRDKYNRLRARRGPVRALMAIAHKLLIAAFHMLATGETFRDLGESYLDRTARKRSTTRLVQRLSNLDYDVILVPKAA